MGSGIRKAIGIMWISRDGFYRDDKISGRKLEAA